MDKFYPIHPSIQFVVAMRIAGIRSRQSLSRSSCPERKGDAKDETVSAVRQLEPERAANRQGNLDGEPLKESRPNGPSSSQWRDGVESRRLGMRSRVRRPMESIGEIEETLPGGVDVKFVSVAAPTSKLLDFVVSEPGGSRRCGRAAPEAMACV